MRDSHLIWVNEDNDVVDSFNVTDQLTTPAFKNPVEVIAVYSYNRLKKENDKLKRAFKKLKDGTYIRDISCEKCYRPEGYCDNKCTSEYANQVLLELEK